MRAGHSIRQTVCALGALALPACGSDPAPVPVKATLAATSAKAPTAPPSARGDSSAAPASSGPPPPRLQYTEADFAASEQNRDPFRSYPEIFLVQKQTATTTAHQRNVSADRYSLDELKLVGIVTGGVAPRAMFVDPQGKGWVVTRGEFLGHVETVRQAGVGRREYDLNWRVDRIRENDVVFVRDDPTKSNTVGSTRVIAMRVDTPSENDEPVRR